MTHSDIHSILFRGVISRLNDLYGHTGDSLAESGGDCSYSFSTAFQQRPAQNFAHNYERDKFLHKRDRYILLNTRNVSMIAVQCRNRDYITMYRKPFELVFQKHHEKFIAILEKLLRKFYDEVIVEDMSDIREVDLSIGRSPNRRRVVHEV